MAVWALLFQEPANLQKGGAAGLVASNHGLNAVLILQCLFGFGKLPCPLSSCRDQGEAKHKLIGE
ncbi:hypothetical protein DK37_02935 [Halomonas sp. SUBG004]|nr:hypothetical protein DK37_02935 [Halomonas sp. SUBG004]